MTIELTYDQGTLLLSNLPPGWNSETIPDACWDARIGAYRAPGRAYAEILAGLAKQDRPFLDRVRSIREGSVGRAAWTLPDLRPYQVTALEAWEAARNRGIITLPTGAGKTLTALAVMAQDPTPSALCLVPTRALLEQWRIEIAKRYPGAVGIYGDGSHELANVTIATYESAYRYIARFGHRFDLLVVDECHHFGFGVRDEVLDMAIATRRLGLTATPPSDPATQARLRELIGPIVFELSLGDLAGSYLSDFDYFRLPVDLNEKERLRYDTEMAVYRGVFREFRECFPDGSYVDWIRFASRSVEGRNALAAFREAKRALAYCESKATVLGRLLRKHWGRKILVFVSETDVAYRIAAEHLIMPVTADVGREEREEMLGRFRSGEIRALVSCRVLNEGLDVPDAEIAIILGGTQGAREHIQRVGRTLRPSPGKRAQIYELICRNTLETRQSLKRSETLASPNPDPLQHSSRAWRHASTRTSLPERGGLALDPAVS